jgi:hypothetical protein
LRLNFPRILVLAWLLYSSILGFLYAQIPPNPDQSIFNYIGWIWIRGGLPYRDAVDVNFPGAMVLHALAQLVFGNHLWSFRLFDYFGLLGFVAVVGRFLRRRQGRSVAIVFVPLYQAMYVVSGYWFAGQRDILAAHLVLLAGLVFLKRIEGGRVVFCIAAGALIWGALLIKPTYLISLPILLAIDVALRRRSGRHPGRMLADQTITALTVLALVGLTVATGWIAGVLDDWYDASILFVVERYSSDMENALVLKSLSLLLWKSWKWYVAYAVCGGVLWWRSGDRSTLLVALGVLAATLVSCFAQGKGFEYHFGGLLPVLALFMANFLSRLAAWAVAPRAHPAVRLAAAAPLLIAALGLASKLELQFGRQVEWHLGIISRCAYLDQYRLCTPIRLGEFIRSHSDPDATILTFSYNYDMIIHEVSGRRNAVRFAPTVLIDMARPPFRHADRWHEELESALREHPPRYIVTCDMPAPVNRPLRVLHEALKSDYAKIQSWKTAAGVYECFERRPTTHPVRSASAAVP